MTYNIIITILLTSLFFNYERKNTIVNKSKTIFTIDNNLFSSKNINPIILKVKLSKKININDLPIPCGIAVFSTTFEYEVLEVKSGFYFNKIIFIKHFCARELIDENILNSDSIYIYKVRFKSEYIITDIKTKTKKKRQEYEIID